MAITDDGQVVLNPTIDFVAGTVAGIAGLVVGFPFDTVKVRFQNPAVASKYHSTIHAITSIVREERFVGLYKGIMAPLATVALMNGLVFSSYRFLLKIQLDNPTSIPTITQIALAGAGSGIVSSIVTTPTELIKIRQQSLLTQTTARKVVLQIIHENGVAGLYRGLPVTALRDCGYGAYFAAYEATCRYLSSSSTTSDPFVQAEIRLSWPALLLAGGIAGIAGWLATFPLDVVKTRMQGSPTTRGTSSPVSSAFVHMSPNSLPTTPLLCQESHASRHVNPYRTILSTIVHSYRTEGFQVFFRGLSPTLIRAVPVNMATFATFEAVVHAFS